MPRSTLFHLTLLSIRFRDTISRVRPGLACLRGGEAYLFLRHDVLHVPAGASPAIPHLFKLLVVSLRCYRVPLESKNWALFIGGFQGGLLHGFESLVVDMGGPAEQGGCLRSYHDLQWW